MDIGFNKNTYISTPLIYMYGLHMCCMSFTGIMQVKKVTHIQLHVL